MTAPITATSGNPRQQRNWTLGFLAVGLVTLVLALWPQPEDPRDLLTRILDNGELTVATVNSPATYYRGADHDPYGFEYELAKAFADQLDVELTIVEAKTYSELFELLDRGQVDLLAAGMTATDERRARLAFGPPYQYVTQEVIYRAGNKRPKALPDLNGAQIHVVADSSYAESLALLASDQHDLRITANPGTDIEDLFAAVANREIDFTIADSNIFEAHRRFYPRIERGFSLTDPQPIAWAFRPGDDSLRDVAWQFISQHKDQGALTALLQRHFEHLPNYDRVDTQYFLRHVRGRLRDYESVFKQAAQKTGLDWRLLAAVGYQESHWRRDAVSPTGVQGLMMLTQTTADELGIADRSDPEQSIHGGARYLKQIIERIPQRITEPDRSWMALAAYNVGFGHLEDARVLTQRQGGNPDRWADVAQRLPLLSDEEFFKTTKYGRARGHEPVEYVRNIRSYFDILIWYSNRTERDLIVNSKAAE